MPNIVVKKNKCQIEAALPCEVVISKLRAITKNYKISTVNTFYGRVGETGFVLTVAAEKPCNFATMRMTGKFNESTNNTTQINVEWKYYLPRVVIQALISSFFFFLAFSIIRQMHQITLHNLQMPFIFITIPIVMHIATLWCNKKEIDIGLKSLQHAIAIEQPTTEKDE